MKPKRWVLHEADRLALTNARVSHGAMGDDAMTVTHLETEHGDSVYSDHLYMRCVLIHPNAKLPTRGSAEAAGFDLYAAHDATVIPGIACAIDTGVAFEIPKGYYGAVCQRSGLARKGVICTYGVCDADYRGAIGVTLFKIGGLNYEVTAGDRVAQLLILPVAHASLMQVSTVDELSSTERQANGFGSTGLR